MVLLHRDPSTASVWMLWNLHLFLLSMELLSSSFRAAALAVVQAGYFLKYEGNSIQICSNLCEFFDVYFICFQDLCRTMPSNACFQEMNSIGIGKLKRILLSIAWLYPDIGYCQGMGMVGSYITLEHFFIHGGRTQMLCGRVFWKC